MSNILEVDSGVLVRKLAEKLKEEGVAKPEYIDYAKTGAGKERVPSDPDFWYTRCASVLRQTYLKGPIGISRLRTRYGVRKKHIVTRHHHFRSGGSLIKDAFDALEKQGYVKKTKEGRVVTQKGQSFLDKTSSELNKGV
jgi:small subunit ribosomal protein S19e